jgi:hypothetical protein
LEFMIEAKVHAWWKVSWKYTTPSILVVSNTTKTTKRKWLRDSKTLYLLLRKSNGIARSHLWPEGTTTTNTISSFIFSITNLKNVFLRSFALYQCISWRSLL